MTAQVVAGALENIGLEMGHKLAHCPVLQHHPRSSEDFGAVLLDSMRRQLCECPISTRRSAPSPVTLLRGVVRAMNLGWRRVLPRRCDHA